MDKNHVIVALPLEVPKGKFCWDGHSLCQHFGNEGGHATCDLNIGFIKDTMKGYEKPEECKTLKEL